MVTHGEATADHVPATSYGTIQMRVVVLDAGKPQAEQADRPADYVEDDEPHLEAGRKPIDSYLERPKRGRQCVVFLVNGQRQHGFDNTFVVRDLGYKYLRNRLVITVDLDGLAPEATAELMQGSRQGFYEGKTLQAIRRRMALTLKNDPDLQRLEDEAEQQIAQLSAGDEVVRGKLDKLIEDHHHVAENLALGAAEDGQVPATESPALGKKLKREDVVVSNSPSLGVAASEPVIVVRPDSPTARLRPDQQRILRVEAFPPESWAQLEELRLHTWPSVKELHLGQQLLEDHAAIEISFEERSDSDDDEYPVETTLRICARFKDCDEIRMATRRVVVSKPRERRRRPEPELKQEPTMVKATSRQPVKLRPGGPSTHVKLRWDGLDTLALGTPPPWTFRAQCTTLVNFPPINFTKPEEGRFELLLDSPPGLAPGLELEFEVVAEGPSGKMLSTKFLGGVLEPPPEPEARKVKASTLERPGVRRPPYALRYVKREDWNTGTCWGESDWTADEAGCFAAPTKNQPLTLLINQDFGLLDQYREEMKSKKLVETTVQERLSRYTTHVAYHLYQIHQMMEKKVDEQAEEENGTAAREADLHDEVNRVAHTLINLMKVSR